MHSISLIINKYKPVDYFTALNWEHGIQFIHLNHTISTIIIKQYKHIPFTKVNNVKVNNVNVEYQSLSRCYSYGAPYQYYNFTAIRSARLVDLVRCLLPVVSANWCETI